MKRLLIYSHDTFGIGHIRRTQKIAQHLASSNPNISLLAITGSSSLPYLSQNSEIDFIKLPTLTAKIKQEKKIGYISLSGIDRNDIVNIRRAIIMTVAKEYKPDIFLSDMSIGGVDGELVDTLEWLKKNRPSTKLAIGFRDLIDNPISTIRKWRERDAYEMLDQFYDRIFIYGDEKIFDFAHIYQFNSRLIEKTSYCGYLIDTSHKSTEVPDDFSCIQLPSFNRTVVFGMVGGGIDGREIIELFLKCSSILTEYQFIAVLGSQMNEQDKNQIRKLFQNKLNVNLLNFVSPEVIAYLCMRSSLIVTMGGYNSLCEALPFQKPIIVIPRCSVEEEQTLRAERFESLGLIRMFRDDSPERLSGEIVSFINDNFSVSVTDTLKCTGFSEIVREIEELLM